MSNVKVNTVCGPISPEDLGITLMHEHIQFGWPGWYGDATIGRYDREAVIRKALDMFEAVKDYGVRTYLDATANDTGRDPELLREISERSGINIICTTGYYTEQVGAAPYFRSRRAYGSDVEAEIYEMFVTEINEGIAGTGIKPGVIKVASGKGTISDYERAFFKAAAKAHRETGVPIITHTDHGTMGPEQAELLLAEGGNPKRIAIGHMDYNTDIRYHRQVLAQDVFVSFDRLGIQGAPGQPLDTDRFAVLTGLLASGYGDKILVSHDHLCNMLGRPTVSAKLTPNSLMSDWYPTHLFKKVIPALMDMGVSDGQIRAITVDNPRRLFSGE